MGKVGENLENTHAKSRISRSGAGQVDCEVSSGCERSHLSRYGGLVA